MKLIIILVLTNILKLPGPVLVVILLLRGLHLDPQTQRVGPDNKQLPLHPIKPGRISFGQIVSHRPLRDVDEKLVHTRLAVSTWALPSGTSLSPLMLEIGRCASFKPTSTIKTCLYMRQWWLALIVAWACVAFCVSLCGGVCATWIDGTVYRNHWHRPAIEALLWLGSGGLVTYSLVSWSTHFGYQLVNANNINDRVYIYYKLPTSWILTAMISFGIVLVDMGEIVMIRIKGKRFTVDDLMEEDIVDEGRLRTVRRLSSKRRKSSGHTPLTERRRSEPPSPANRALGVRKKESGRMGLDGFGTFQDL